MTDFEKFARLVQQAMNARDPEEIIPACEAAIAMHPAIGKWPPGFPHEQIMGALHGAQGNAYANRVRGERVENVERAIAAYEGALTVRTRDAFPEQWAATQHNLATAYANRICGEQAGNLELAIAAFEAALTVRTQEAFPQDWAMTQNSLANAYSDRIRGERADNLERAITAFEAALTVRTREAFPQQWAVTQNNLASVYARRIRGQRADNLERAIGAYEVALTVRTREAFPQDWAMTQNNLAIAYRNRIRGEPADNIERAIVVYEAALTVLTREGFPQDWAVTQNNLAAAYAHRIRGERADNLERAIAAHVAVLAIRTREAFPQDWAMTQNNLAMAYADRIRGERADNLERAIAAYEAALTVFTREAFPEDWAMAQNNLANAYAHQIRGERADNLERAIAAFAAALTVRTREAFPEQWAATQNNLATAYADRIRGERADNLELAIAAYEAALTVFTREAFPGDWAMAENNLANAYAHRIRGERAENLERSIAAYEAALAVYTREAFPQDWAVTQNNLAAAYADRSRGERAENLERSIAAYEAALTVFAHETFPQDWAMTQNNLAAAYADRIRGERADNIERAITACEAALAVYTREAYPQDWAMTQNNVANAYRNRILGERAENIGRAIAAYEAALAVYTRGAFPRDHLRTACLLGRTQLAKGEWRCAGAAYAGARQAFLLLFGQGLNQAEAEDVINAAGQLFTEAAYAAAEQRDLVGALNLLTEGRARLIGVVLRQLNLPLSSAEEVRLASLRREIREAARETEAANGEAAARAFERLIALRRELGALIEAASEKEAEQGDAAVLAGKLAVDGGAIVAPIITSIGGKALVVAANGDGPELTALDLPELTTKRLRELLWGPDPQNGLGGWLVAYNKNYEIAALFKAMDGLARTSPEYSTLLNQLEQRMGEWLAAVAGLGPDLWHLIGQYLSEALERRGVKLGARVIWMPTGALGILPIGLAEDPVTGRRFGDDFDVVNAPSLETLSAAERWSATEKKRSLAAAAPDSGLASAEFEISVIASHFDPSARTVLVKSSATSRAVLDALRSCNYWHFATHGAFHWGDARQSYLRMAGGETLTVGALMEADGLAKPRLVALSACETGLYDFRRNAEEFIGLPGTFMALGAAGVLGTLWPVEDRATALLTAKFYDLHLGDGVAPPMALKQAQTWLRDATRGELVAYAKAAAARSGANGEALADQLEASLLRGAHDDPRLAALAKLVEQAGKAAVAGGKTLVGGLLGRKLSQPRIDDRPFAHPYYWGGFTYTGL